MTPAYGTMKALRRRALLAAAMAMTALAGQAQALADRGLADLRVVDRETGQTLTPWRHHGRQFIVGEPGARYALRVTNRTAGRVEVVLSVDGVNVISGDTAGWDQNGYVLHPYETYDVIGWRKSNREVAAFAFAPLPQSYAARTGRPGEVGVIGMAVFTEQAAVPAPPPLASPTPLDWPERRYDPAARPPPPPPPPPPPSSSFAAPMIMPAPPPMSIAPVERPVRSLPPAALAERRAAAAPPEEKLGTAHGAREVSVVVATGFIRATHAPQILRRIEYDTYANLVARGVIPASDDPERRPRPFPSSVDPGRFVPDPPPER